MTMWPGDTQQVENRRDKEKKEKKRGQWERQREAVVYYPLAVFHALSGFHYYLKSEE